MSENQCVKKLACCFYIVFPIGFHIALFFVMGDVLCSGKVVLEKKCKVVLEKKCFLFF